MIPRSTKGGLPKGFDYLKAQKVIIDEKFTVDLATIKADPNKMRQSIQQNSNDYEDTQMATVASFADFAQDETVQTTLLPTTQPQIQQQVMETKVASFSGLGTPISSGLTKPDLSVQVKPKAMPKSLASALVGESKPSSKHQVITMKKVTFELPIIGQFAGFYHDIIREDDLLILIFDHSQGNQSVWFPPVMEDPSTHEPSAIPAMLHDFGTVCKVYPTGVKFRRNDEEFCLLTI